MLSCNTIICRKPFRSYSQNLLSLSSKTFFNLPVSIYYRKNVLGVPCLYIPALKRISINAFRYQKLVRITCIRRTYLYLYRGGRTSFKEVMCLYIPVPMQRAAEHLLKKLCVCTFPHLYRGRQNMC